MASPRGTDASDLTFPNADGEAEAVLNPSRNKKVDVDPVSSQIATSLEIKERVEAEEKNKKEKEKEKEKKDAMQTFKTSIIVSGIIVAVAGAIFAITKKLKEK